MKTVNFKKPSTFNNATQFGVAELNKKELSNTNGGEPITLTGAAAVAAGGAW